MCIRDRPGAGAHLLRDIGEERGNFCLLKKTVAAAEDERGIGFPQTG